MTGTYEPGVYLLNYDGDILSSYEIITVNSNGLIEISCDEQPYEVRAGDTLTPLGVVTS